MCEKSSCGSSCPPPPKSCCPPPTCGSSCAQKSTCGQKSSCGTCPPPPSCGTCPPPPCCGTCPPPPCCGTCPPPPCCQGCPEIPPAKCFDVEKWAKRPWYVVFHDTKDELHLYDNQKCIRHNFEPCPTTGEVVALTKSVSCDCNTLLSHTDKGQLTCTPGLMNFPQCNPCVPYGDETYRVVDTDYETFSVGVSCSLDKCDPCKRYVSVGLYARNPDCFPKEKVDSVSACLRNYGLDLCFKQVNWKDCPVCL